jgi:hypothetical protein
MTARPTLRCLREDLGLPVPSAQVPLDEIDHPLLRKAQEQFAAGDTPHERIRAIDDVVLFKVKTGAGTRLARRLNTAVRELVRGSLRDGHEHAVDFAGFRLGIIVRAEDGHETYVAIRITGSVHSSLTTAILSRVPGCASDAWFPEYALPERELLPAEQAWSNIMDPKAASQLLEEQP